MFPDQDTFKREEQRRFEILLAHWDLPIVDVDLNKLVYPGSTMNEQGASESVEIVPYADEHADVFARLNREWLERYSLLENGDLKHLDHPRESILDTGGEIFIALIGGVAVGTCASIVCSPETVELAKLAVDGSARGRGIGLQLVQTVIAWAREREAKRVENSHQPNEIAREGYARIQVVGPCAKISIGLRSHYLTLPSGETPIRS